MCIQRAKYAHCPIVFSLSSLLRHQIYYQTTEVSHGRRDTLRNCSKKKKKDLSYLGLLMHINISVCGNIPCWMYSNENASGQLLRNPK